jgi:hypothetical protein
MNSAVKIIKRTKNGILTERQADQNEITARQNTRELARTVKGWIADLHRRRRDEGWANSVLGKIRVTLSLIMLSFWGWDLRPMVNSFATRFAELSRQL